MHEYEDLPAKEFLGEEVDLVVTTGLSDVLDSAAEQRRDLLFEVELLGRVAHLGGDPQGDPARRATRAAMCTLVWAHPAEEQRIAAVAGPEREAVDVDTVVDHGGDGNAARCGHGGARSR